MNLLVGGTGFVGGHVVEYLFQQGEISKGVFRKGSHLKIMDSNGVQGVEADLQDRHSLHQAMEGVDVVYNMASPMPDSDTDFWKFSTEGIVNLLAAATEAKVKVVVHLSTLDVYGFGARSIGPSTAFDPSGEYQRSKVEAERLLGEFSQRGVLPRIAVIRSARAVGSRDESLVVPLLRMIDEDRVLLPAGGTMSFSHPRDIAQAMFKAGTGQIRTGSAYMIKSFDATPAELAGAIVKAVGKAVEIRRQGFLPRSRLPKYASEHLRASVRIGDQSSWNELGYAPAYDLKGTSEEIANWYKKEPWVTESV
jgi:nucleoside-diphosphate-sugar epimerase